MPTVISHLNRHLITKVYCPGYDMSSQQFLVNSEVNVRCKLHGHDFNIGYNLQEINFQCGDKGWKIKEHQLDVSESEVCPDNSTTCLNPVQLQCSMKGKF